MKGFNMPFSDEIFNQRAWISLGPIPPSERIFWEYPDPNDDKAILDTILTVEFDNTGMAGNNRSIYFSEHLPSMIVGKNTVPCISRVVKTSAEISADQLFGNTSGFTVRLPNGFYGFSLYSDFVMSATKCQFYYQKVISTFAGVR